MKKFNQFLIALSAILAFAANVSAQQIHIKARFIEASKTTLETLQKNFGVASDGTELLTPEQMRSTLKSFRSDSSVETLAEPEVTTIGGRQTQMRATKIIDIITNFTFEENSVVVQHKQMEFGPVLDVVPTVSSDGEKINLTTTASLLKFVGYADTKNATAHFATNSAGEQITLPTVLPQFEVKQASAKITVLDDQTVVLMPKSSNDENQSSPDEQKVLVVMITSTIVDDAGNRIHSDN
jgi:hypothetical protein